MAEALGAPLSGHAAPPAGACPKPLHWKGLQDLMVSATNVLPAVKYFHYLLATNMRWAPAYDQRGQLGAALGMMGRSNGDSDEGVGG